MTSTFSVVVPTLGRPSLTALLETLAAQSEPPVEVVLVDDRPPGSPGGSVGADRPLDVAAYPAARVVHGYGLGPAHARNAGWRSTGGDWVVFVDDDVLLTPSWSIDLLADLTAARPEL
ncbi:MAG TPA: glycosyltransferase, partial [Actinomycetales bacterium]